MKQILIFSLASIGGVTLRYGLLYLIESRQFPWGTLTVNVLGSLLMGICFVLFEKSVMSPELRLTVMTAFLGAFTTFSAFSLDTFHLLESGAWWSAVGYILASVLLCVAALSVAIWLTRALF